MRLPKSSDVCIVSVHSFEVTPAMVSLYDFLRGTGFDVTVGIPPSLSFSEHRIREWLNLSKAVITFQEHLLICDDPSSTMERVFASLHENITSPTLRISEHGFEELPVFNSQNKNIEGIVSWLKPLVSSRLNRDAECRRLRVFLSYARADETSAFSLYAKLLKEGAAPWLDQKNLLPGQEWELELRTAIEESDAVILCLSKRSITKEGYFQAEVKHALRCLEQKPDQQIFVIPVLLDDCVIPIKLKHLHCVSVASEMGLDRLLDALEARYHSLGIDNATAMKPPEGLQG